MINVVVQQIRNYGVFKKEGLFLSKLKKTSFLGFKLKSRVIFLQFWSFHLCLKLKRETGYTLRNVIFCFINAYFSLSVKYFREWKYFLNLLFLNCQLFQEIKKMLHQ